jgi:hypothetical protein
MQAPVTGAAGSGGALLPMLGAAGASGSTAAAPTGSAAAGSGTQPPPPFVGPDGACQSQTFLPRAPDAAPDGVLFLVDRSADMAMDFQGEPRWQLSGHALVSALTPIATDVLRVGAIFYPSSASTAPTCLGPSWLCPPPPAVSPAASAPTCAVSGMASNDQLDFQPAAQALATLTDSSALYQPIAGVGVPLRESIDRANTALATAQLTGRTTVVLMVNAQPSCRWDQASTAATLTTWLTQRRITTHVIALPGANQAGMDKFAALAQAGGQTRVLSPVTQGALQSTLQSIVMGSLSSCMLDLNPPVTMPTQAHLIVGVRGVEQEMRRNADSGEALWTISDDGTQLTLLGKLCTAATAGEYDSLRVAVGCVPYPLVTP